MRSIPTTPDELVDALTAIFPSFSIARDEDHPAPLTFHSVFLFDFNPYLAKNSGSFSTRQHRALAALIAAGSASTGSLENAIDTCFIEAGLGKHIRRK